MNLHPKSITGAEALVEPRPNGSVWVFIGGAMLAMTSAEARSLAKQLLDAAGAADPLVKLEGLQASNEDLSSEHATLGPAA